MSEPPRDKLLVRVANLDCENEAAAIRRAMPKTAGVVDVDVRAAAASVTLWFDAAEVSAEALKEQLGGRPSMVVLVREVSELVVIANGSRALRSIGEDT